MTEKFVPKTLRDAAKIYEERNALYGDVYKRFGSVMLALFPEGVYRTPVGDVEAHVNRYGLLVQIVGKLMRYCSNFEKGGHDDSLDDLAVYAIMLKELDTEARKR